MRLVVEVDIRGPIADGRAVRELDAALEDAVDAVARQAYANVMGILNAKIKRPTPYYETQITVQELGADRLVHDREIVYGRWLEGVSWRNWTTSFKGYRAFGNAASTTRLQADRLVQHALAPHLERMR